MTIFFLRLMADGQSATYILNEEKKENGNENEQLPEKKKSIRKHRSFKRITPPPGVPKTKTVPKIAKQL